MNSSDKTPGWLVDLGLWWSDAGSPGCSTDGEAADSCPPETSVRSPTLSTAQVHAMSEQNSDEATLSAQKCILGREIRAKYPNALHYLCGLRSTKVLDNGLFKEILAEYYQQPKMRDVTEMSRVHVPELVELAHAHARKKGKEGFCIWSACKEDGKYPPLSQPGWEDTPVQPITEDKVKLKERLTSPVRRALVSVVRFRREALFPTAAVRDNNSRAELGSMSGTATVPQKLERKRADALSDDVDALKKARIREQPFAFEGVPLGETSINEAAVFSQENAKERLGQQCREPPIRELFPPLRPLGYERCNPSPESILEEFVCKFYEDNKFVDALDRLEKARGSRNVEEWAREIYITYREDPEDENAKQLNIDRRTCLALVYEIVLGWKKTDFSFEFEKAIAEVFKTRRLIRILCICLPMDRAHALYKLRFAADPAFGMNWYSKLHLEPGTSYARDHPEEQQMWARFVEGDHRPPTMNKKLFRLLFSDHLGLKKVADFRKWARPARVPSDTTTFQP